MKRRALKLIVFLLAGAIINVAVAWGAALAFRSMPPLQVEGVTVEDSVIWRVVVGSRRLETVVFSERMQGVADLNTKHHARDVLPRWAPFDLPTREFKSAQEDGNALENQLTIARGFPMLAFRSQRLGVDSTNKSPPLTLVHGIQTSHTWPSDGSFIVPLDLPTWPIFPGFAINTIFYAAIVWALFAAPGAIRRRVRRKRGQCAACGYSLRENVSEKCPECGAPSPLRGEKCSHG